MAAECKSARVRVFALLTVLLVALPRVVSAAPSPVQREVGELLSRLGSSPCSFYRNGDWHLADEARVHLQRKYDYLARRKLIDSTEQFIVRAATRSSISGVAYRVRCPDAADVDSADWMMDQLRDLRRAGQPVP